jgi:uncharacterized protein YbbK (DUF523 family)
MAKINLIISSCLCGNNTKYNGGNNLIDKLDLLKEKFNLITICPEVFGGLTTPRNPSEIIGDKVFSNKGLDVTDNFHNGAKMAVDILKKYNAKYALLKEGSPSCGVHKVYDGTFSGVKISGSGITTQMFKKLGIIVFSENEVEELLKIEE